MLPEENTAATQRENSLQNNPQYSLYQDQYGNGTVEIGGGDSCFQGGGVGSLSVESVGEGRVDAGGRDCEGGQDAGERMSYTSLVPSSTAHLAGKGKGKEVGEIQFRVKKTKWGEGADPPIARFPNGEVVYWLVGFQEGCR